MLIIAIPSDLMKPLLDLALVAAQLVLVATMLWHQMRTQRKDRKKQDLLEQILERVLIKRRKSSARRPPTSSRPSISVPTSAATDAGDTSGLTVAPCRREMNPR